ADIHHPNAARPSRLDRLHAARIAALPLRNEKGFYEEATPDLTSSSELGDFIRDRCAAWRDHMRRLRQRRPG
ncbi:MAG: phosphoesterase, partial [Burkholderiales bacterium]|nr:phosphoesterase [Burkholderiales bacterium]